MSKTYAISLSNIEIDQLLKILYYQQIVADETAINLIAKLNRAIHEHSPIKRNGNELSNKDLDLSRVAAAETYHRYRSKRMKQSAKPEQPVEAIEKVSTASTEIAEVMTPAMDAIARSLEAIANCLMQQEQLGFGLTPGKRLIYCNGFEGQSWYYLNEQQQALPIVAPALTCRVQFLEFRHKQQSWKTHCHVQADRPYCLESDYNSPFSKSLLLAIASLTPEQLQQPITIEALPATDPTGLTCRVYVGGTQVLNQFGKTPKWKEVARQAINHVEIANGRAPRNLSVA